MIKMRKKADNILLENVIFIVLNLVFFGLLITFVVYSGSAALVYERVYAKKIALNVDQLDGESAILLDVKDAKAIADKNKKKWENVFNVDNKNNLIIVTLSGDKGYSYRYFSDLDVELKVKDNWLTIAARSRK